MAEIMRYVVKKFYPYFWHKFDFPVEDDAEQECTELVKSLREAVWAHRIVSLWHWRSFLTRNLESMVSSNETYVSYIFLIVSATTKDLPNIHESFMTSCSLVTGIAAYVYDRGYHEFLDYCPDILMILFEENYSNVPGRVQVWDYLRDHLITCRYSEAYNKIEEKTRGKPFSDIVNDPAFVTEIKELIKSKISVSEQAAAYRCTLEVIKRSKDRTSRNLSLIEDRTRRTISIWTGLSQTEELFQNTEDQRKSQSTQKTSHQFELRDSVGVKKLLNVNAASITRPEKPLRVAETSKKSEAEQRTTGIQTDNLNLISVPQLQKALDLNVGNENRISTGVTKAAKISPTQSEKQLKEIENEKRTAVLKNNKARNLEPISSTPSKRLVAQNVDLRKKPENEQSPYKIGVVLSDRISSSGFEQPLGYLNTPRMYQNEEWIAGLEEKEFGNLEPIYSTQSERLVTQGVELLGTPVREQSAKKIEVIVSDRISSSENSLMELEKLQTFESEQRISTYNETINFKLSESHSDINKEKKNVSESRQSSTKVEDTEADYLKASPSASDKKSIQNVEKSRISSGENASMVEIEAFGSKPNSVFQKEQTLQENVEEPEMPENVQALAVTEETMDMNSNQIPSLQSEETLQDDTNEFQRSDSELNPFVQSSDCSRPEGNTSQIEDGLASHPEANTSQIEDGLATVDNDSEIPLIMEDKKPILETPPGQMSKKKRKKKPKSKLPLQDGNMPDLVKDSEPTDSTTSSPYKEQSVQTAKESVETETSFIIPTKKRALYALLFLMERLQTFLSQIYDLLNVPRDGSI